MRPPSTTASDLAAGRLVRPFGEALAYDFAYYVIHKKKNGTTPAILAFKDWLLAEAEAG
ncbi:MAG: hypothetical protein ABWY00_02525 [Dongiaceae bacterium]